MSDYERTFSVRVPPARAFRAFTDPSELEQWFATRFDADTVEGGDVETPGGPMNFKVTEVEPDALLRYRQWAASPDTGIDVTVVFEAAEGGTTITVTHAGFGGESILQSDQVRRGMDESYADLALYLDHGVSFPRHRDMVTNTWLGADLRATPAAPEVVEVAPGTLAETIGLRAGDLLVQLGRGSVFDVSDVAFFLREHDAGDEVDVAWVRDAELRHGRAALTPRDEVLFAHRA